MYIAMFSDKEMHLVKVGNDDRCSPQFSFYMIQSFMTMWVSAFRRCLLVELCLFSFGSPQHFHSRYETN